MSRSKTAGIAIAVIAIAVVGVATVFATEHNIFTSGSYYTKVDNAHAAENEADKGLVSLKSREPYIYTLPAYSEDGAEIKSEFGTSRELKQDAYLLLEYAPLRGVVSWEEVALEQIPADAAAKLG